ncbi:MAG TPA: hypothetical protein VMZ31_19200 [Phycisphaerae bacterium]|nr:hypothetical protein [Phycisphaerae bacterium]
MARRDTWPTWKIIAVMLGALVVAVALWPLGGLADAQSPVSADAIFTLGTILRMFSLLGMGVALIMGGWLGWRYYRSIPAWRRRRGLPPPRR